MTPPSGATEFALAMYDHLRDRPGNLVFSPFSVRMALRVALLGARSETAVEMRTALRVTPAEASPDSAPGAELRNFQGAGGRSGLAVVNVLWTQEGRPLLPAFCEAVAREFQADLRQADFLGELGIGPEGGAAEHARLGINAWVAEQTRNRIIDLVPPGGVSTDTGLALVNAVWFKDRWVARFDPEATRHERFHLGRWQSVRAALMHQRAGVAHAQGDGFQAVDLAYVDTTLSMLVLLPDRRNGLEDLEGRLSLRLLHDCVAGLRFREIELFLPRFRIESASVELSRLLAALGMPTAFSRASADFSGINGMSPPDADALYLSAAWHKAFVEVDESGTEAAAATALNVLAPSAPMHVPPPVPVFRADHPFLFAIRDRRSGHLLFLGRVVDPTQASAP